MQREKGGQHEIRDRVVPTTQPKHQRGTKTLNPKKV